MALDYKSSLARYRRYLQTVQQQPMWQASLYVILSLGLVIILIFSALRPTLITIAGLLGQIKQESEVETKMDKKIALIQEARQAYSQVEERLNLLDEAVPTKLAWSGFVKRVDRYASESGVQLRSISVGPVAGEQVKIITGSNLSGMDFNAIVVGDYLAIKEFVSRLMNSRRMLVIEKVAISREAESGLTAGVTGKVAALLDQTVQDEKKEN